PIIRGSALKALEGDPEYAEKIKELMKVVDEKIPTPEREVDKPFLMPVEDVFSIKGRGTVGTGRIERGKISIGDPVEIIGIIDEVKKTTCTGVEMFNKTLNDGQAGDNVGLLLRGVEKKDLERGQVVAKPGSITPHTKFIAEVYVLTKEEGGRHTPFFAGYRPQFFFRTTDVTGAVHALMSRDGTKAEMCMPGDNITMEVEIISPIAMEDGLRFAIREGGRTVGAGVVTEIIE
ncbi:hypothetical protein LCGC14_1943400, partial [marine sediment metagenome]